MAKDDGLLNGFAAKAVPGVRIPSSPHPSEMADSTAINTHIFNDFAAPVTDFVRERLPRVTLGIRQNERIKSPLSPNESRLFRSSVIVHTVSVRQVRDVGLRM